MKQTFSEALLKFLTSQSRFFQHILKSYITAIIKTYHPNQFSLNVQVNAIRQSYHKTGDNYPNN
jgi:hypothetical protein